MKQKIFLILFSFLFSFELSAQEAFTEAQLQEDNWLQQAQNLKPADLIELKKHNFDFTALDDFQNPLLYYILTKNPDPELVSQLIEFGADVNQPAANGMLPLNVTTSKAHELQLQMMMFQSLGLDLGRPEIRETIEYNIFLEMSRMTAIAEILIKAGADVNRLSQLGTPLMNAASNAWNIDIVKLLIDAGANINQTDQNGRTALFYAASGGNDEIIDILLKAGADPTIKDADGKTFEQSRLTETEESL